MTRPLSELAAVLDGGSLAARLPDIPRWVELRADLLSGRAQAYGADEDGFVALDPVVRFGYVVGRPSPSLIQSLGAACDEVLAPPETAHWASAALPDWRAELATVHVLSDPGTLPAVPSDRVRLVGREDVERMAHLPADLREEMRTELRRGGEICAAFAGDRAVSFCYAGPVTERWWDISIDTLDSHRRQGFATACVVAEIVRRRAMGLDPVWGALAGNLASFRLAARLGFVPHDAVVVLEPDPSSPGDAT